LTSDVIDQNSLPVIVPGAIPWTGAGCYNSKDFPEGVNSTTSPRNDADPKTSPEVCINFCQTQDTDKTWIYAAALADGTCFCSDGLPSENIKLPDDTEGCNVPCQGYEGESCGTNGEDSVTIRIRLWFNTFISRPSGVSALSLSYDQSAKVQLFCEVATHIKVCYDRKTSGEPP